MRAHPTVVEAADVDARALVIVQRLAVAGLVWALGALAFGTLLVAFDVDAGCQGWPLCSGSASPPADHDGLLTFVHRLGGLGLALVIGALMLVTYLRLRSVTWLVRLTAALFLVVLAEAVVGGFGVAVDFPGWTAALHMTLALALIAGLFALIIYTQRTGATTSGLPRDLLLIAIIGAFGALFAGSAHDPLGQTLGCDSVTECLSTVEIGQSAGTAGGILPLLGASLAASAIVAVAALRRPAISPATRLFALLATLGIALAIASPFVLAPLGAENAARVLPPLWLTGSWLLLLALALPMIREPALGLIATQQLSLDRAHLLSTLRDYFRVTKPGIMLLLLTTTLGGMLVAAEGWPGAGLVALTLVGGALASGGASALNCYFDRDVDQLMARTRKRPIPTGGLSAVQVRGFALLLSVAAVIVLAAWVNPLAAVLAVGGHLFYITIYTLWLKRRTPQNIVIGGAAGSFPPLVGWAAVTGSLALPALLIAAIIFYWTPPHFWSLALLKANDYRRAGIPMLPVTHGEATTRRSIFLYALLLVAVTALLGPAGGAGWLYLVVALLLGSYFVALAARMWVEGTSRLAWRLFKYSNYYLALLLAALVVDRVLGP